MASAGRILIMPKGNYDSSATYEMLDLVKHNGTSWLAKKTATGIEPSDANSEYWQNLLDLNIADALGGYKISTKIYTGTTDENGFLTPYDITVDTTDILSCKITDGIGFCTPYVNKYQDTDEAWSFLIENWDKTRMVNASVTIKVIYVSALN